MSIFRTGSVGNEDRGTAVEALRKPSVALTAAAALFLHAAAGVAFAQEAETQPPAASSPAPVEQPAPSPAAEPEAAAPAPAETETPPAPASQAQPAEPAAETPQPDQPAAAPEPAAEQAETPQPAAEAAPQPEEGQPPASAQEGASETPAAGAAPQPAEEAPPAVLLDEDEAAQEPADGLAADEGASGGVNATLPHDLSPWGMFMAADWVVKAVMIGLAFASVVTWTVWVAKSLEIAGAKGRLAGVLRVITRARRLDDAAGPLRRRRGPGALLVRAAEEEVRLSAGALDHAGAEGLKDRVGARLQRIQAQAGRRLGRGTGLLATIGSTAPFVGLFGTVWGIMNSFIGISEAQTTNLAVVAPGIAEALLATAMGLLAAIPAVVFYNMFARSITGYRQMLADAGAGVELLVSRDLDYRLVPGGEAAQEAPAAVTPIAAAARKG